MSIDGVEALHSMSSPQREVPVGRVLSEENREDMREAFDLFDVQKTGSLDYHTFGVSARSSLDLTYTLHGL